MTKKAILIIIISLLFFSATIFLYKQNKQLFFTISEEEKPEAEKSKNETNWQWVNEQKKLYELTSTEIDSILKEVWERFPNKTERLKALSILRLGTPYQRGCLGEESGRDKEPIFRLDVTDCTVFVLTNVALLHSQTLEEAREMMKFLNYRPDKDITFENRLHFTTDRNEVSPYFRDLTTETVCGCKLKTTKVILNKIKTDGKRLIDIDWEKETLMKYIPTKYITKGLFANLPEAVGIAFIKEGDEKIGLDVRHEGFLFDGETLFHTTSGEGKIVTADFFEYYFERSENQGSAEQGEAGSYFERSENQGSAEQGEAGSYFDKDGNPRFDGIILFDPVVEI